MYYSDGSEKRTVKESYYYHNIQYYSGLELSLGGKTLTVQTFSTC